MNESSTFAPHDARYELHFPGLVSSTRGYAFPCDAKGHVDIDGLSEQGRYNYFHAWAVLGKELCAPIVALVADQRVVCEMVHVHGVAVQTPPDPVALHRGQQVRA